MPGWSEIDGAADRPDQDAIIQSWGRLDYEPVPVGGPETETYLACVREVYARGGVILARFRVAGDDETLRWFAARNRLGEYDFFQHFLASEPVRQALPQLGSPRTRWAGHLQQCAAGLLTLDGELAAILTVGGAYKAFRGRAAEAKRLGRECVTELTQDRYEDFLVFTSHTAWAPWFHGMTWDATWLLVDRRNAELTLLCLTDQD